jgi:ATP-dependent Clp protease ATP-binding subunit ClpC
VATGQVPQSLRSIRILDVNLSFLMAGASAVNEAEGRLKEVLDAARADHNTVLFFDELHVITSPLHQGAQLIKPDLGRGRIRCIGATTQREFRAIEDDAALARRFQPVPVMELTPQQSLEVLRDYAGRLAAHHRVVIDGAMLQSALELSQRHVPQRRLPDKALDLLDEACALARIEAESMPGASL